MRTVIIGGGASGMMAAIAAAKCGDAVSIIEKNNKPGKKILATGNGRCNFSNVSCRPGSYFCSDGGFVEQALKAFSQQDAVAFFDQIGIYPRNVEGRLYPYSEQASAVLDVFLYTLKECDVRIRTDRRVISVIKNQNGFCVHMTAGNNTDPVKPDQIQTIEADKVIIATGGKAGEQYGCLGDGYKLAERFGHTIVKPLPALVQLTSEDVFLKETHGVRAKGEVSLYINRQKVMERSGEIQFTKEGLSGICVFDVSRVAARAMDQKKSCELSVDLMPEINREELKKLLTERIKYFPGKSTIDYLDGLVSRKLRQAILKKANGCKAGRYCSDMSAADVEAIAKGMKEMRFKLTGTKGWRDAQTTTGGIVLEEVRVDNMESKKAKGLHFCGEILDVDGVCGGYNLQWAWTSGYLAGHRV